MLRELLATALAKGETALTSATAAATAAAASLRARGLGEHTDDSSQSGTSLTETSAPRELRAHRFRQELAASCINVEALKRLSTAGIPDQANLRPVVWKVLLGYLPPNPDEWDQVLARRRTQYHIFCDELIVDPKRPMQQDLAPSPQHSLNEQGVAPTSSHPSLDLADPLSQADPLCGLTPRLLEESGVSTQGPLDWPQQLDTGQGAGARGPEPLEGPLHPPKQDCDQTQAWPVQQGVVRAPAGGWQGGTHGDDHPLSLDAASTWNTYFKDNEILEQITRDVVRTHPSMPFFTGQTEEAELHRQELRRALFMYAKLNPGLRYIQGMNELIAPLYWVFKGDPDPVMQQYAEADAFWCFMELISEFRDHFCQQLDNAQTGIRATIRRLMTVLQAHDHDLWRHIELDCKVDPQYYAFRWITLLLSQEFALPDTLRIWDQILGDPHGRMDCLLRICTAMILQVKPLLLRADFGGIMKLLQRFPAVDVAGVLAAAAAMPACSEVLGPQVATP